LCLDLDMGIYEVRLPPIAEARLLPTAEVRSPGPAEVRSPGPFLCGPRDQRECSLRARPAVETVLWL
jgi:hypothetical protein